MLTLTFQYGAERRGLPYREIVEVVALVELTALGDSPRGLVGAFDYHGTWVPALDLSQLTENRPARRRWSTRILIVRPENTGKLLGLVAESATEMIDRPETATPDEATPDLGLNDWLEPDLVAWLREFSCPPPSAEPSPPPPQRRRPRHYTHPA